MKYVTSISSNISVCSVYLFLDRSSCSCPGRPCSVSFFWGNMCIGIGVILLTTPPPLPLKFKKINCDWFLCIITSLNLFQTSSNYLFSPTFGFLLHNWRYLLSIEAFINSRLLTGISKNVFYKRVWNSILKFFRARLLVCNSSIILMIGTFPCPNDF